MIDEVNSDGQSNLEKLLIERLNSDADIEFDLDEIRAEVQKRKVTRNLIQSALAAWHEIVRTRKPKALDELLAGDVVFYSPVVHTRQVGKAITTMYLTAALHVFGSESFRYVREVVGESDAVLEFETEIDGIVVNGVDMIKWNGDGKITEFKVMVRPLKAINLIHQKMGQLLSVT
jgi:SnoaL-like domain